jgi:hypothetical protein
VYGNLLWMNSISKNNLNLELLNLPPPHKIKNAVIHVSQMLTKTCEHISVLPLPVGTGRPRPPLSKKVLILTMK